MNGCIGSWRTEGLDMKSFLKGVIGHRGKYDDPVKNPDCTVFEVDKWAISRFVVERLTPVVGCFPFPLDEQMLMVAAICGAKPSHIFEWGTNIGVSARIFYETCSAFKIQSDIHTIDLPDDMDHVEHPGHQRGRLIKGCPGVNLHQGDGLDTALLLCREADSSLRQPLFFVDGDHAYGSVKRELVGIFQSVPDAVVLVHDTFYQSPASGYNIGPYHAIKETLNEFAGEWQRVNTTFGLPGMTLLSRKPLPKGEV